MEDYTESIHTQNQAKAEIEALSLLWSGTIRIFTPTTKQFDLWLRRVGYVDMVRVVNDVGRNHIKHKGNLLPGQLIHTMQSVNARAIQRQQKVA